MKNVVCASFENPYNDRCVDIFLRPDGSFGYEEFRRDAEDRGLWQSLSKYSQLAFDREADVLASANDSVTWLAQSPAWQRHLRDRPAGPAPSIPHPALGPWGFTNKTDKHQ